MNNSLIKVNPSTIERRYKTMEQVRHAPQNPHIVLTAYDRITWQRVIIKQINLERMQTYEKWKFAYDLLCRECALLQRIYDPRIPRLLNAFIEGSQISIVLEYITGSTLEQYLNPLTNGLKKKRVCPQNEVINFGIQICGILCYIHGLAPAIIHRDIKPANIIRRPCGDHVLLDFGNGREFGAYDPMKGLQGWRSYCWDTIQGIGTSGYAPPEQYTAQSDCYPDGYEPAHTTPISDLYSLGVIMHEMLTGNDPIHQKGTGDLFLYPSLDEWVYRGEIHSDLASLIEQLLEWEPDLRPQSAYEVAQRLQAIQWNLTNATFLSFPIRCQDHLRKSVCYPG